MELLGREEELLSFQQFLTQYPARNLIVHGPSGTGKSYFFQKIRIDSRFRHLRWVYLKILDPIAPAQAFLLGIIEVIRSQFNQDEEEVVNECLTSKLGCDFSLSEWTQDMHQSSPESGLIFHKVLKIIQESIGGQFLIVLDQVENLSLESLTLLKHVIEWKPEDIHFVLGLTTSNPGKDSIQQDFDHLFYFKANQYLEMCPLDPLLKELYYAVYGIESTDSSESFMSLALEQKKAWLIVQCSLDSRLKRLSLFLAHFPAGLRHHHNPYHQDFEDFSSKQPLLLEIFQEQGDRLFFSHQDYIDALISNFESDYYSIRDEVCDLLESQGLLSELLMKEIEKDGLAEESTINQLLEVYINSLSLSRLQELTEASLEQNYSEDLKYRLTGLQSALMIKDSDLNTQIPKLCDYFDSLDPTEKPNMGQFLYRVFLKNGLLEVFFDRFFRADWIAQQRGLLVEILIGSLRQEDLIHTQVLHNFNGYVDQGWLQELKELWSALVQEVPAAIDLSKVIHLPMLGNFINGLNSMAGCDYLRASQYLEASIKYGILEKNFTLYSLALTRLSECSAQLGDFDMQIRAYREAVVAEQFLA